MKNNKESTGTLRASQEFGSTAQDFKKIKYLPSRKNIDTDTYAIKYSTKEILEEFQTTVFKVSEK
jgi:hypothetical protein